MNRLKLKKQKSSIDKTLASLILALTITGLIVLADASTPTALARYGDKYLFVKQQVIWAVVGVICMFVVSNMNYKFWEKHALKIFGVNLVLLFIVLLPGLGIKSLGARRWLDFGIFSIQPSELTKLILSIYLAKVAAKDKELKAFLVPIILVSILTMLQPDLGTTLIIALIGLVQLFVSGASLFYFIFIIGTGILATIALILVSPYRRQRLETYFSIGTDPLGSSYHVRQILFALGNGGLLGLGFGNSKQKHLFLPETSTDSIFAIVAEELGFVGGLVIILLFVVFIYKCIKITENTPDKFSAILAAGITAWIGGQTIINLSSMVALTPLTGVPLPFFSYGGSSLVTVLIGCGILLNISRYSRE